MALQGGEHGEHSQEENYRDDPPPPACIMIRTENLESIDLISLELIVHSVQRIIANHANLLFSRQIILCVEPRYVLFEERVHLRLEVLWIVKGVEV